nr:THAP domain-containing protein 2-like [Onthophagus taurus]
MYCFVCKVRDNTVSHHLFPKDPDVRQHWLRLFSFEEDDIFKNTKICGKHFENNCFVEDTICGRKTLRKGSVPTFIQVPIEDCKRELNFDDERTQISNKRQEKHSSSSVNLEEQALTSPNSEEQLPKMPNLKEQTFTLQHSLVGCNPKKKKRTIWRPCHPEQVDLETGFLTPRRARHNFSLAINKISAMKKKIIKMNRRKRTFINKIKSFEELIKHLKQKNMLSEEADRIIQVFTKNYSIL